MDDFVSEENDEFMNYFRQFRPEANRFTYVSFYYLRSVIPASYAAYEGPFGLVLACMNEYITVVL